jgi:hypothetical protein
MSFGLRALVAAAQQNDDRVSLLPEIDAIAGTVVDTQLADAFTNRLHIADMPLRQPIQS